MAWEENSCISLNMQLIAILSRIGVWMTAQMQMHIREVNSMFADERKKVRERYKEYDGCYLGHYAQWFFWFFFTIGMFVVAGGIGMMIAQNYDKQ